MGRIELGRESFFWINSKVEVGWIGNPTKLQIFHHLTQPTPLFWLGC